MGTDVSIAVADTALVGEGPFWDAGHHTLHWVDILRGAISSFSPASGERTQLRVPTLVGAAVPKASGGYVAATREGFADITADGRHVTRVTVLEDGWRMNDAKCDPQGRLWAGSTQMDFNAGLGVLHVLDTSWRSQIVLDGLTLPNGLGWSPDGATFYLVDSIARELNAFDTVPGSAELARRRVLATFGEEGGLPDGLTIDSAGCLWIAMFGGGRIVRLSPDGALLASVDVPVAQPTSCVFGGPGLDVLYVTTARNGLDIPSGSDAADGSVFAIQGLGATGLPSIRYGG